MREIRLRKELFVSLRDAAKSVIHCRSGIMWVTQAGDPRDHVLHPEEELVVTTGGTVIVEARREGVVEVGRPG